MEKKSDATRGKRKFSKAYRQGYADGLALVDAVLEIGESWQPGSHPKDCTCMVCEVTGRAPDKLAESWAYKAALDYADGDRKIACEVVECGAVQDLLADGDFPGAIVSAAALAEKYAELTNLMRNGNEEEEDKELDRYADPLD